MPLQKPETQGTQKKKFKLIFCFSRESQMTVASRSFGLLMTRQLYFHLPFGKYEPILIIYSNQFQYKLLYRASEHNFSANQFHKRCDGIENTLVIVKNEFDKIIGGFTPNKWSSKWELIKDQLGRAFIFSLNLQQMYKCTNPQNSIGCFKSYGPVFGGNGGHDLFLSDNANENNKSYCNFPHSYNLKVNGTNKYQQNQKTYTLFAGATSGFFKVKQYQIYQIKVM